MKTLIITTISLLIFGFVYQPKRINNSSEIIHKYFEAIGGKERLERITTRYTKYTTQQQSSITYHKCYQKRPIGLRLENYNSLESSTPINIEIINEKDLINVKNGVVRKLPNMPPQYLLAPDSIQKKCKLSEKMGYLGYFDKVLNWLSKEYKHTLITTQKIKEKECYEIKLTGQYVGGKSEDILLYFDTKNFLLVKMKLPSYAVYYDDYREINGIKIPFIEFYDYDDNAVLTPVSGLKMKDYTTNYLEIKLNENFDEILFTHSNKN
jgi:hypothetical protein